MRSDIRQFREYEHWRHSRTVSSNDNGSLHFELSHERQLMSIKSLQIPPNSGVCRLAFIHDLR